MDDARAHSVERDGNEIEIRHVVPHARVPERGKPRLHAHTTGEGDAIHLQVRREPIKATVESSPLDAREPHHH